MASLNGGREGGGARSAKRSKAVTIFRNQPGDVAQRVKVDPKELDELARLFSDMLKEGLHPGAQLALYRHGELVIELAGGMDGPPGNPVTTETLFQIRSTTKALATIVMLILHDHRRFSFEDTVAKHWPNFGQNGKELITIAQIMSHQASIPDGPLVPDEKLGDRAAVAAAIEATEPIWPPGSANGYHSRSFGWVLDELMYRWEGCTVSQFLKTVVTRPLGIGEVYIGLPEEEFPRMAKMVVEDRVRKEQPTRARFSDFLNTYEGIRLPLSWVGGVAKARDLANLMNLLAYEGNLNSSTYFSKETQKLASAPSNEASVVDRRLQWPMRWGLGFILGDTPHIYGTPPHPRAVGHAGGSGAAVAWADPDQRLAVAFLCNRMLGGTHKWERFKRIGDRVYAAMK